MYLWKEFEESIIQYDFEVNLFGICFRIVNIGSLTYFLVYNEKNKRWEILYVNDNFIADGLEATQILCFSLRKDYIREYINSLGYGDFLFGKINGILKLKNV